MTTAASCITAERLPRHAVALTTDPPPANRSFGINDISSPMTKTLLFLLLITAALFGAAAASAQQPSPPNPADPKALSPAEAQRALEILQDPQKRAQLIETLQAIARAQPLAPEKPAAQPEPVVVAPNGLGAQLLAQLSSGAERLTADFAAAVQAVTNSPLLWRWVRQVAADPEQRAAAIDGIWQLLLVLIGALLLEAFAAAVMKRPMAALTMHAPANGDLNRNGADAADVWVRDYRAGAWRLLRRLPFALARLLLELIPVAVFVGIAGLLAGMVPSLTTRAVILVVVDAYAITRIVLSLGRMLVSPAAGRLRLLHIGDTQADYLIRWLRRITIVAAWGGAIAQIALLLGLNPRAADTLIELVGLIVAVMLVIVVLRGRHAIARYLQAPPDSADGVARWRNWIAAVWHYLAIVAILAGWLLWATGIRNGLNGLRLLLATVATLVVARLVGIVLLGLLDRAASPSRAFSRRFPGFETRTARYHTPARMLINLLLAVTTAIVLLQVWGVGAFLWFEDGRIGARLLSALATVALAAFAAILVWEGANAALERRLALLSDPGSAAHAARLRTLLPMLRATLFISIVAVVGLTALSEIGINVGPLLAGAGIVGVAVGFGSQKLVQDVITGMFALFENALQVGESVTVAGLSGTVEDLSIRAIWLRGSDGAVHVVPFSAVTSITNSSRGPGNAAILVMVASKEDTDRVVATLTDIAAEMRRDPAFESLMLGDPEVWVDAAKADGVTLAGKIACTSAGRVTVEHEFNRRLLRRFQELGIELGAG
jgi:moderate conductance mechanosensitive channel